MTRLHHRVRRAAAGALALAPIVLAGCGIEDNLLEPQQPGIITPEAVEAAGATGAQALYVGAIGALQNWSPGGGNNNNQNIMMYADLLTDVWETSDTFSQRIDMDRRVVQTNDAEITGRYATITQSRGYFRDALNSLKANLPAEPEKQAEMYFALGLTELSMGEVFCNGIPLGETNGGVVKYSKPYTNAAVFTLAVAHLDSALALTGGTNALSVRVKNAALVAKGRALVDLGKFTEAAAAVASVPLTYQYALTFSQPTLSNVVWVNNYSASSSSRYSVGDSVAYNISTNQQTLIRNAIPFASAKDPRVPVTGSYASATKGFDGGTPYVRADAFNARETPMVLASGIDARLIEAEAKLQANDIAGMMTILNALRTTAQTLGNLAVPAMAALPAPASQTAAASLFFREKAFWQFARGMRLGDLRRLVRQYGRTEDQAFPEGGFGKPPFAFGDDMNFPVPDSEKANSNFTGCIDRKA
jgi:hypothetical protein